MEQVPDRTEPMEPVLPWNRNNGPGSLAEPNPYRFADPLPSLSAGTVTVTNQFKINTSVALNVSTHERQTTKLKMHYHNNNTSKITRKGIKIHLFVTKISCTLITNHRFAQKASRIDRFKQFVRPEELAGINYGMSFHIKTGITCHRQIGAGRKEPCVQLQPN